MTWTLTGDVERFDGHARPLLAADPVRHTIVLTLLDRMSAGHSITSEQPLFGWYDDGRVVGAILQTPPFELLLAAVPLETIADLVATLQQASVELPGVNGDPSVVDQFAADWTAGSSIGAVTGLHMRLYKLSELRDPVPPPRGSARLARAAEQPLLVGWLDAFQVEARLHEMDSVAVIADRVADGRLWVWVDPSGTPVSFAGRQQTAGGVARVGPVYTPPPYRRQGFGAGVTAAVTADALNRGAHDVVLFTDLSNPTSNAIYQQIGYEPVTDRKLVRFTAATRSDV